MAEGRPPYSLLWAFVVVGGCASPPPGRPAAEPAALDESPAAKAAATPDVAKTVGTMSQARRSDEEFERQDRGVAGMAAAMPAKEESVLTSSERGSFQIQKSETSTEPAHIGYSSVRYQSRPDDPTKTDYEETVNRKYTADVYARYLWKTNADGQQLNPVWKLLPSLASFLPLPGLAEASDGDAGDEGGSTVTGIALKWNASGSRREVLDALKFSWVYETEAQREDESGNVVEDGEGVAPAAFKYNYGPDFEKDREITKALGGHFYWQWFFNGPMNVGPRGPGRPSDTLEGFHWQPTIGVEFGNLYESAADGKHLPIPGSIEESGGLNRYGFAPQDEIDEGTYLRGVAMLNLSYRPKFLPRLELRASGEFRRIQSIDTGDRSRWYADVGVRYEFELGKSRDSKATEKYARNLAATKDMVHAAVDTNDVRTKSDRPDPSAAVYFGHKVGELPPSFGRFEVTELALEFLF